MPILITHRAAKINFRFQITGIFIMAFLTWVASLTMLAFCIDATICIKIQGNNFFEHKILVPGRFSLSSFGIVAD